MGPRADPSKSHKEVAILIRRLLLAGAVALFALGSARADPTLGTPHYKGLAVDTNPTFNACLGPMIGNGAGAPVSCMPVPNAWLAPGAAASNLGVGGVTAGMLAAGSAAANLGMNGPLATAPPTIISSTPYTIQGPGWYLVTVTGAALFLPAATAGRVTVTDGTMASNPGILINGTINGSSSATRIGSAGGSLILGGVPALSSWWIVAGGSSPSGGGGGGGYTPKLAFNDARNSQYIGFFP